MSTISTGTTTTTTLKHTGDTTGALVIKTNDNGTGGTTAITVGTDQNVTLANALSVASTVSVTGALTTTGSVNAPNTFGFKNRIINGAMVIDQRNAGASVTPVNLQYLVDRFFGSLTQASKFTAQRSTTTATGFINSLLVTSSSAYSVLTGDTFLIGQSIEGFNVADLSWGTANAQTVTLSFWVRSSLTGTFGGALTNNGQNRSYPFSYTINSANTFEQKTVTITGDTTGTWATDTSTGITVRFGLGSGATYSGTAGAWAAGNFVQPTGTTSVVGTNGATFYITGVQLETGSTATSFDYRPYGTELMLCQRYYQKFSSFMNAFNNGSFNYYPVVVLKVTMRATPTLDSGASFAVSSGSAGTPAIYSGTGATNSPDAIGIYNSAGNWTTNVNVTLTAGFNSEL